MNAISSKQWNFLNYLFNSQLHFLHFSSSQWISLYFKKLAALFVYCISSSMRKLKEFNFVFPVHKHQEIIKHTSLFNKVFSLKCSWGNKLCMLVNIILWNLLMCEIANYYQRDSQLCNFLDFHYVKFQYPSYFKKTVKVPWELWWSNLLSLSEKCQNKHCEYQSVSSIDVCCIVCFLLMFLLALFHRHQNVYSFWSGSWVSIDIFNTFSENEILWKHRRKTESHVKWLERRVRNYERKI